MRFLLTISVFASTLGLSGSGSAQAGTVADQVTVGSTTGSPRSPRNGFLFKRPFGMEGGGNAGNVTYDAAVTSDSGAPAAAGSPFRHRGGTIFRGSLGLDWQISSKWAVLAAA